MLSDLQEFSYVLDCIGLKKHQMRLKWEVVVWY